MTENPSPTKPKKSRRSSGGSNGHRDRGSDPSVNPGPVQPVDQANEKEPQDPLPTFFVLFINVVIIGLVMALRKNGVMLPCVTPQGSALSIVCISLVVSHIIWRFIYPFISKLKDAVVKLPFLDVPLSVLIALLNVVHPWRLKGWRFVLFLLFLAIIAAFVPTPLSTFRIPAQPFAIQGFAVQRSTPPLLEHLAPGGTLMMKAGEKVILDVVLIGNAQVSCTWSTVRDGNNVRRGCSIDYTAFSPGDDILSVFIQPACESRQEPASLFVTVQ